MGFKTAQDYLLHMMKTMTETSVGYAHVINRCGEVMQNVEDQNSVQAQELKISASRMLFSINELNRITHQINRCLHACESGNVEEMERLRDEIMKEREHLN